MHATQTYEGRLSDAERQYLDIARSLGWIEGSPAAGAAADDETEGQGGGGGTGMGPSVSVISPPTLDDLDDSSRLHEYAMRGDVAALSAFLSADEGADINVRDEYVSLFIMPCHSFRATGAVIFRARCGVRPPSSFVLHTNRDTLHSIWLPIEETPLRSSFYLRKAQIRRSR